MKSEMPNPPVPFRLWRCLRFIAEHPCASSRRVANAAGVVDQGQMSRLGVRLVELGLAVRAAGPGGRNAWTLTARGKRAVELLDHDPLASVTQLLRGVDGGNPSDDRRPARLQR
jgi:hypothetical protein